MAAIGASAFPAPATAQPPAQASPQPAQAAPAIPSASAAYQEIEKQGLQEAAGAAQERDKRLADRDAWLNKAYQLSPLQRLFTSPEAYRDYSNIVEKHAQRRTDEAQLPLADVIHRTNARVEAMRQAVDQNKLDVTDFNSQQLMKTAEGGSDESKYARGLMKQYAPGVPIPDNVSALALQPFFKAVPELGKALESYRTSQKTGAETGQIAADSAAKRAKDYAEAKKAIAEAVNLEGGKPIPEQMANKFMNQASSLPEVDELEQLHEAISSPILGKLLPDIMYKAKGRYEDAVKAKAPAIAAGALPLGRETPQAVEEFIKNMPSAAHSHARAKARFAEIREAIRSNVKGQVDLAEAGKYSKAQVDVLRKRVDAADTAKGDTVDVISPEGKRGKLPRKNLDTAKKRGFKLAGT